MAVEMNEVIAEKCDSEDCVPGLEETALCLRGIALHGVILNGFLVWADLKRRTIPINTWKEDAIRYFTEDEIADAKSMLWDVCDESMIGRMVKRQGQSKTTSEINDICNALSALSDNARVPLFIATSTMIMQLPKDDPENVTIQSIEDAMERQIKKQTDLLARNHDKVISKVTVGHNMTEELSKIINDPSKQFKAPILTRNNSNIRPGTLPLSSQEGFRQQNGYQQISTGQVGVLVPNTTPTSLNTNSMENNFRKKYDGQRNWKTPGGKNGMDRNQMPNTKPISMNNHSANGGFPNNFPEQVTRRDDQNWTLYGGKNDMVNLMPNTDPIPVCNQSVDGGYLNTSPEQASTPFNQNWTASGGRPYHLVNSMPNTEPISVINQYPVDVRNFQQHMNEQVTNQNDWTLVGGRNSHEQNAKSNQNNIDVVAYSVPKDCSADQLRSFTMVRGLSVKNCTLLTRYANSRSLTYKLTIDSKDINLALYDARIWPTGVRVRTYIERNRTAGVQSYSNANRRVHFEDEENNFQVYKNGSIGNTNKLPEMSTWLRPGEVNSSL